MRTGFTTDQHTVHKRRDVLVSAEFNPVCSVFCLFDIDYYCISTSICLTLNTEPQRNHQMERSGRCDYFYIEIQLCIEKVFLHYRTIHVSKCNTAPSAQIIICK